MIQPTTHYEQQLMAIYNTGTRLGLIQALKTTVCKSIPSTSD